MSETVMSAPAGGSVAAPAPTSAPAAGNGGEFQASVDSGHAPGVGGDATAGGQAAQGSPSAIAAAKFRFANREYDSQKHAEEAILGQIGRTPSVQRENAALKRRISELESGMVALRGMGAGGPGGAPGQGVPGGQPESDAAPPGLADRLAGDGTLNFLTQIANDPEMGIGHALYEAIRLTEQHVNDRFTKFRSEAVDPIVQRTERAQVVARGFDAARQLVAEGFSELDDNNHSPEAEEAQQWIVSFLEQFPPGVVASNAAFYLRSAAMEYRRQNGTPLTAQPPGSSGAPSSALAAAAEAAASGSAPIDGSGMPRPGNGRDGPNERWRRENAAATQMVKSASGKALFRVD